MLAIWQTTSASEVNEEPTPTNTLESTRTNTLEPRERQSSKLTKVAMDFGSGVVGGAAAVASGQPFDKMKTLQQTGIAKDLRDAARILWRQGIRSMYAGGSATLSAEVMANAIAYSCFQAAKAEISRLGAPEVLTALLAGGFAGAACSAVYSPMDLIKIRLQTQAAGQV